MLFISVTLPLSPSTPPGAQEIRYAQIGQTVTLDPPEGIPENYYLEWRLNGREFAWTNHMGGRWVEKGMELSGSSLTVKDINENQFGIYMCNVSDKSRSYRVLRLTGENSDNVMLFPIF